MSAIRISPYFVNFRDSGGLEYQVQLSKEAEEKRKALFKEIMDVAFDPANFEIKTYSPFSVIAQPLSVKGTIFAMVGIFTIGTIGGYTALWVYKRLKSNLSVNVDTTEPKKTLEDIIGNTKAKAEVCTLLKILKAKNNGKNTPPAQKSFLFYGPPGTGKTVLAEAMAGELKLPFISTAASKFDNQFIGVGASNVRLSFAAASKAAKKHESKKAILFVDEIDALFNREKFHSGNNGSKATLLQFFKSVDENPNVIVVAATNYDTNLDAALSRRFEEHIHFQLPNQNERRELIEYYLKKNNAYCDADNLEYIAGNTQGLSGAILENIINSASREVWINKTQDTDSETSLYITREVLVRVTQGEIDKVNRRSTARQGRSNK